MREIRNLAGIAALFAFTLCNISCDDDDKYESYPPTWKGFQVEKDGAVVTSSTVIRPGDVIKVTAVQDKKGHLINATNYYWNLSIPVYNDEGTDVAEENLILEYSSHTNYDGLDSGNPSCTFTIPDNAYCGYSLYPKRNAVLNFEAKYNYSGNGIQVENGAYDTSLSGSITPYSGSMAGGAKGTLRTLYFHSTQCGH